MDRLVEAVAAHLCRHRASVCSDSRSTLRGAAEEVRDAEAKRRCTLRERGLAKARRRPSTGRAC